MWPLTYVRSYICTFVRSYVRTYVRTYIRTFVCMYVRTFVRTYVCTYISDIRYQILTVKTKSYIWYTVDVVVFMVLLVLVFNPPWSLLKSRFVYLFTASMILYQILYIIVICHIYVIYIYISYSKFLNYLLDLFHFNASFVSYRFITRISYFNYALNSK